MAEPQEAPIEEAHPPGCVEDHPLHCCHIVYSCAFPSQQRGYILKGWKCSGCAKKSKATVLIRGAWYGF